MKPKIFASLIVLAAFAALAACYLTACSLSAPLKARVVRLANSEGKAIIQLSSKAAEAEAARLNAELEKLATRP